MSRPNFRIVEGTDDFPYDDFIKDFQNLDLSRSYLQEKYGLSDGQYYSNSKYVKNETGFSRPRGIYNKVNSVYITKTGSGKYRVSKTVDNCRISGTFKDFKTAEMVRDIMVEWDWDMETMKNLRKIYGGKINKMTGNQYSTPLKNEALSKFKEFKKLYFKGEDSYYDIMVKLGFTKYMYQICLNKLTQTYPNAKKPMVKS